MEGSFYGQGTYFSSERIRQQSARRHNFGFGLGGALRFYTGGHTYIVMAADLTYNGPQELAIFPTTIDEPRSPLFVGKFSLTIRVR